VTSSSTLAGGILSSCGFGFNSNIKTLAVAKAYTTRVGSGPFPTECSESPEGRYLQEKGGEFGATTGRRRRCGWLDLPALNYAIQLNSVQKLALMKLDVLSGLDEIKLATSYREANRIKDKFTRDDTQKLQPVYKTLPGWKEDISSVKSKKELPVNAIKYLDFISEFTGIAIDIISVGSARRQTLFSSPKELIWDK